MGKVSDDMLSVKKTPFCMIQNLCVHLTDPHQKICHVIKWNPLPKHDPESIPLYWVFDLFIAAKNGMM